MVDFIFSVKTRFGLFLLTSCYLMTVCSYVYEPSSVVTGVISYLEEQRNSLIDLQERHNVKVWHIMYLFSSVVQPIVVLGSLLFSFVCSFEYRYPAK